MNTSQFLINKMDGKSDHAKQSKREDASPANLEKALSQKSKGEELMEFDNQSAGHSSKGRISAHNSEQKQQLLGSSVLSD